MYVIGKLRGLAKSVRLGNEHDNIAVDLACQCQAVSGPVVRTPKESRCSTTNPYRR